MASILDIAQPAEPAVENTSATTVDNTQATQQPKLQTGQQFSPTPEKKDVVKQLSNILPRMTYYGPTEFHTKVGDGCSKIAAATTQRLYGIYDPTSSEDAWYAKKSVLDAGGKEVWNPSMKNDYSKMQIGTYVSLDRFGNTHDFDKPKNKKYTLADNEKVEHRGVVVGFDKDGMPLIKHGSSEGEAYVQRMDKLFLPFSTHTLNYTVKSAYTPASIVGKDIVDKRFYTKPEESDIISYNPTTALQKMNSRIPAGLKPVGGNTSAPNAAKENELKFVSALNNNLAKQTQILGLQKNEANLIARVAFGIFHNESKAGYSAKPIGGKMLLSSAAHALGRKNSPSLSDVQFKFDDLVQNADGSTSKVGQNLLELGVEREGLSNWTHHRDDYNDEVNAVAASAAATLARIKANPEKYNYDPKTQTIHGDVSLGVALAAAYSKGMGVLSSKEAMMKADKKGNIPMNYGNNAMSWGDKLNITPKKKEK